MELITSIEDILLPKTDETKDNATAYEKKHQRTIKILIMVTFIANIVCSILFLIFLINSFSFSLKLLVIIKIVGAVISKSLSVLSSVVDSVVDLLTSVILIWTARKIKKRDAYKYPGGYLLQHVIKHNTISSFF